MRDGWLTRQETVTRTGAQLCMRVKLQVCAVSGEMRHPDTCQMGLRSDAGIYILAYNLTTFVICVTGCACRRMLSIHDSMQSVWHATVYMQSVWHAACSMHSTARYAHDRQSSHP